MNLKKICHAYSRFLVAFVLSGSANSSDKQEGSKDETLSSSTISLYSQALKINDTFRARERIFFDRRGTPPTLI